METKSIGLALGGGGARGLAHIGVLKVLERAGIFPSFLAGTSMGGLVAAAYAAGYSPCEIEARALKFSHLKELMKLIDLSPQRRGLLEGHKVRQFIRAWIGESITFSDLKIPTLLTSVDLVTGTEVILSSGDLLPALFATIAIPGIFDPVLCEGQVLVDGGVLDNLPVRPAREMGAAHVIAIDVLFSPQFYAPGKDSEIHPRWPFPVPKFFTDLYMAEMIMIANITQNQLQVARPDILIRPDISPDVSMFFGFHKAAEIIKAGELAAEANLDSIRALAELA